MHCAVAASGRRWCSGRSTTHGAKHSGSFRCARSPERSSSGTPNGATWSPELPRDWRFPARAAAGAARGACGGIDRARRLVTSLAGRDLDSYRVGSRSARSRAAGRINPAGAPWTDPACIGWRPSPDRNPRHSAARRCTASGSRPTGRRSRIPLHASVFRQGVAGATRTVSPCEHACRGYARPSRPGRLTDAAATRRDRRRGQRRRPPA